MCIVKTVDFTGLDTLHQICHELRHKGVKITFINVSPPLQESLTKFNITNDESTKEINFEHYEKLYQMDLWSPGGAVGTKIASDVIKSLILYAVKKLTSDSNLTT